MPWDQGEWLFWSVLNVNGNFSEILTVQEERRP
jgi:hypothetical protein